MFRESILNTLVLPCVCATDNSPNFLLNYLASVGSILPRFCRSFGVSFLPLLFKGFISGVLCENAMGCPIISLHFHVIPHAQEVLQYVLLLLYYYICACSG